MFLKTWTLSTVIVVIVMTMFKPTTASELSKSNDCRHSACSRSPRCPSGYDTLSKARDGCSSYKKRKYCCRRGKGPDCFFTGCTASATCPLNYRKLDANRKGCSLFSNAAYCCKTTHLPSCFDLSCPSNLEESKSCPLEYNEISRVKGGCDSGVTERVTCCKIGFSNGNNVTQGVNPNPDYNGIQDGNPNPS